MVRRIRSIAVAAILAVLATPELPAAADDAVPRVGHVRPRSEPWGGQFYEGLRDEGFVDGKNVVVIARETGTDFSRAGPLTDELIALGVKVIVAQPGGVTRVVQGAINRAGKSIPIVFYTYDPIEDGFLTNLARPDRNMTGLTSMVSTDIFTKQLELLLEIAPDVSHIAYLRDPTATPAAFERIKAGLERGAKTRGVRMTFEYIGSADEIEKVLSKLKRERVGAFFAPSTAFGVTHRRTFIDTAARLKMPAIYSDELFARDGGLISYWTSMMDRQRGIGRIVGMLLKGKTPADIPVDQPTRFKLTINAKTAKALGLELPPSLLMRADEVVQ